jgi:hypothetical protein
MRFSSLWVSQNFDEFEQIFHDETSQSLNEQGLLVMDNGHMSLPRLGLKPSLIIWKTKIGQC